MSCGLIPVVEIGYHNQGVEVPKLHPRWEYPSGWLLYYERCYRSAGFPGSFVPYLPGLPLYPLSGIPTENLPKLVQDHLEDFLSGDLEREAVAPLFGGYVLTVNGEAVLYPQCCGDLSDLKFWRALADSKSNVGWEGHPSPLVTQSADSVVLQCIDTYDEFYPPVCPRLLLDHASLRVACDGAEDELKTQVGRFEELGQQLGIENLAELVLYGTR